RLGGLLRARRRSELDRGQALQELRPERGPAAHGRAARAHAAAGADRQQEARAARRRAPRPRAGARSPERHDRLADHPCRALARSGEAIAAGIAAVGWLLSRATASRTCGTAMLSTQRGESNS